MGCVISARARRDFGQRSTHMLRDGLSACQPAPQQRSTTDASGAFADRVVIDRKAGQAHYRCASRARCARNGKRPAGYQKAASPSSVRLACTGYRCCRYRRPTATGSDRAQSFAQQHAGIVMEVPTHRPRVRALVQRIPPVVSRKIVPHQIWGRFLGPRRLLRKVGLFRPHYQRLASLDVRTD